MKLPGKLTIERIVAGTPEFKDLKKHIDIQLADEGLKIELLEHGASGSSEEESIVTIEKVTDG